MTYEEYRAFQFERQIKMMMQRMVCEDPVYQNEYFKSVMSFAQEYRKEFYPNPNHQTPRSAA